MPPHRASKSRHGAAAAHLAPPLLRSHTAQRTHLLLSAHRTAAPGTAPITARARMHQGRQRAARTLLMGRKPAQKRERDDAAVARGFCGIPAFQGAEAPCRVKSSKQSKEFPERVEDDEKPNSPRLVRPNDCATEPARASLIFREASPVAMCSIRSARLRTTQASAAKGCGRRW